MMTYRRLGRRAHEPLQTYLSTQPAADPKNLRVRCSKSHTRCLVIEEHMSTATVTGVIGETLPERIQAELVSLEGSEVSGRRCVLVTRR